jgi:hypothetical protein
VKHVLDTELADLFDSASSAELIDVFLLDVQECELVWSRWGERGCGSLFEVSDDHWTVVAPRTPVAKWHEAYSSPEAARCLSDLLLGLTGWGTDQRVLLIQSRTLIASLSARDLTPAFGLMEVFDDGPLMVLHEGESQAALRFLPRGDVVMYQQAQGAGRPADPGQGSSALSP